MSTSTDNFLPPPPKRPVSVGSDDYFSHEHKRMKKDAIRRPLSREEMYDKVAKEHEEDARFLIKCSTLSAEDSNLPPGAILAEDDTLLPCIERPLSRSDNNLAKVLTPAIGQLMNSCPRETSPNRTGWRRQGQLPFQQSIPLRVVPSHIRTLDGAVLPPSVNTLGVPENMGKEHLDAAHPLLEHSPHAYTTHTKPTGQSPKLLFPTNADIPERMAIHENMNSQRPVTARDFYVLRRTVAIAEGGDRSRPSKDGTIRLSQEFFLTNEELDEMNEYWRFLTGHETFRRKTMVRFTCRPQKGGEFGQKNHAWPENVILHLNGTCLQTSMVCTTEFSLIKACSIVCYS